MEDIRPKERLIKTAIDLFYKQGYDATSVNHIIEASATHKASFYRYFKSKEELGEEYLTLQGNNFNDGWAYLMAKADSPQSFVNTWVSLVKRQVKSGNFFGCPVAKFMSSSEKPSESHTRAKEILAKWIATLANYFEENKKLGKLVKNFNSQKKAERFLKLFQGNSQFYIMTGDAKYFDEMKQEMLDELENQ
jgi:TetR/AcrR family transcriptional regulator, transcriptional repressor for nem operon